MTCIFIFQYETTLRLGYTFAMSFIAMSSRLWRQLLKTDSPEMLVIVLLIEEACNCSFFIKKLENLVFLETFSPQRPVIVALLFRKKCCCNFVWVRNNCSFNRKTYLSDKFKILVIWSIQYCYQVGAFTGPLNLSSESSWFYDQVRKWRYIRGY